MTVRLGSERLLAALSARRLRRVGVVANPSSIGRDFVHVVDLVAASGTAELVAIFGPQHGFHSDVQENMIETGHARDAARRVAVYSLYSETRMPTAAMLERLSMAASTSGGTDTFSRTKVAISIPYLSVSTGLMSGSSASPSSP